MKTMNLNAAGVLELDAVEMREVEGGSILKFIADTAFEVYQNWDACVAAFKQGLSDGMK
jgi:hypothetical protein